MLGTRMLAAFVLIAASHSPVAAQVRVVANLPYGPAAAARLDVYLPASAGGRDLHPAVVYFHGGGWYKGDKATLREKEIGRTLAGAGYVFFSANYSLGRNVWPRNLEDCFAAFAFAYTHAAAFGVDFHRVALMGASAGAHLALLVAYEASSAPCPPPTCVIDLYGITDLLTRRNVAPDGTPLPTLDDAHSAEMLGVSRTAGAVLWRAASPVAHVTANCPPTLIIQGLADQIVDYGQSVELANALRAAGVPHELLLVEGVRHEFDLEDSHEGRPLPRDLRPVVLGFLNRYSRP
jgi:acetyl esterase/lipase